MTDPSPDLAGARLAFDAAVRALVHDTLIPIERDHGDDPDVTAIADEWRAAAERAARDLAAARACGDRTAERLAGLRLLGLDTERRARIAARGWTPSLLDQLRDAVESSSSTGGQASAGAHRAPIGLAAAELLAHIERTARCPRGIDLAAHLHTWAQQAGHWQTDDPDQLLLNATLATRWAGDAHNLLNPSRPLTAVGSCPDCGRSIAHVKDDTGEVVRRAALQVDRQTGIARCIAPGCGATWGPSQLELLAAVLHQQAAERDQERQAG